MKYIDADLLRKEIDEQMKSVPREVGRGAGTITSSGYGMMQAFQIIRSIIDSLQQEQPCEDLKGEIREWVNLMVGASFPEQDGDYISEEDYRSVIRQTALHFYELGKQGKEPVNEDLEEEIEKYFDGWVDDPEYGQAVLPHTYECVGVSDCKDIARHFYILGLKNNISVTQITLDELAKEGEPVSEDLEEATARYGSGYCDKGLRSTAEFGFWSGAEWQEKQMGEQARKELAKTDLTLADLVAFDEGLKLGRRLERQDMLKDTVKGTVCKDKKCVWIELIPNALPDYEDIEPVKCVVMKED